MKFTAYKYRIIKEKLSITKQIVYSSFALFVFGFIILFLNTKFPLTDNILPIIVPIFIISMLFFGVAHIYQFYDYELINCVKEGHIEFSTNEFIIDYNNKINYEDVTDLKINIDAYYGQTIDQYYRNPLHKKSLGIKNTIVITTWDKSFTYNFKLEHSIHTIELKKTIFNLVLSEKLGIKNVKKLIKLIPSDFNKTEDYKAFVIKQITSKKINCTEGLLLHGYKTDKEAKELRNKYCV